MCVKVMSSMHLELILKADIIYAARSNDITKLCYSNHYIVIQRLPNCFNNVLTYSRNQWLWHILKLVKLVYHYHTTLTNDNYGLQFTMAHYISNAPYDMAHNPFASICRSLGPVVFAHAALLFYVFVIAYISGVTRCHLTLILHK